MGSSTTNEAMVMLVHIAMKLAPYGVAALLFKVVGTTGLEGEDFAKLSAATWSRVAT